VSDYPDDLREHRHRKGDGSWWEHDAQGIPLTRVCAECREAKLSMYRPEILTGYDQSDVDEPIDPEPNPDMYAEWDRVNYAQRMAEKSGDYAAIQKAKDDVRSVYNAMQEERRRVSRNPDSSDEWHEVGQNPYKPSGPSASADAIYKATAHYTQGAAALTAQWGRYPKRSTLHRHGKVHVDGYSSFIFVRLMTIATSGNDHIQAQESFNIKGGVATVRKVANDVADRFRSAGAPVRVWFDTSGYSAADRQRFSKNPRRRAKKKRTSRRGNRRTSRRVA
jgi:hypothetical protein